MNVSLLFLTFIVMALVLTESSVQYKYKSDFLIAALCVITLLLSLRTNWPDENVYIQAFEEAPLPWEFALDTKPFGYVEKGYLFLASLIKLIAPNSTFYIFSMAALSMFLLYKCLTRYAVLPLIGLCTYVGRFLLNRDGQQIRSSLAILLIILAVRFIQERKPWHYFGVVLLAYQFHHMALLAVPMYFLPRFRISTLRIVIALIFAMICSVSLATLISSNVEAWSEDLQYETYTQGQYVEQALGLANPMIYFQTAILLLFSTMRERLVSRFPYYDLLRWGYFYSTFILIFFSQYTALSGRTSTMFATFEIFILGLIATDFGKTKRYMFYAGLSFVWLYFFASKYNDVMHMINAAG